MKLLAARAVLSSYEGRKESFSHDALPMEKK
jgi:hypothetical protein